MALLKPLKIKTVTNMMKYNSLSRIPMNKTL